VPTATVAEDTAAPVAMPIPVYPRGTTLVCGEHVDVRSGPTGAVVVGLHATTTRMGPDGTWTGTVTFDADDVVASHVAFVGMPQVVVVGAHDGRVVAVGQGDLTPARAGSGTGRVLVDAAVRFPSCDSTRPLGPGSYRLVAVQHYQDRADWPYGTVYAAVSAPVTLTVARDRPTTGQTAAAQPSWLAGTPLACGIPAASLADLPGYFPQYLDDLATPADQPLGIVVHNAAGGPAPVTTGRWAAVAWVRDGRVVSVGADVLADPVTRVVPVGGQVTIRARLDPTDSCRPPDGSAPHRLPAGSYLAVPYAQVVTDRTVAAGSGAERARSTLGWLVGLPRGVVVHPDGTVRDAAAQDG
jgi:hypothetical protein